MESHICDSILRIFCGRKALLRFVLALFSLDFLQGYKSGTSWRNANVMAALDDSGYLRTFGLAGKGGFRNFTGIQEVVSAYTSFSAITLESTVISWGANMGASAYTKVWQSLGSVRKLYTTDYSYAALLDNGEVKVWGSAGYGGSLPKANDGSDVALHNIIDIYSTRRAFCALNYHSQVTCWGDSRYGGYYPPSLHGYYWRLIASNDNSFAAITYDNIGNGAVKVWGDGSGYNSYSSIRGASKLYAAKYAFACLRKNDVSGNKVVSWGYSIIQPFIEENVKEIYSTEYAFAALLENETVKAWGNKAYGGLLNTQIVGVEEIYATDRAFTALLKSGSVFSWGPINFGGVAPPNLSGVKYITANSDSFVAYSVVTSSLVVWGNQDDGVSYIPNVSGKSVSALSSVYHTFCVLFEDGTVQSWGRYSGGDVDEELYGVALVYGWDRYNSLSRFPHIYHKEGGLVPFPTSQPTTQPTSQPTTQPSTVPTRMPLMRITGAPTSQPSTQPTNVPSGQPTSIPTSSPSSNPTFFFGQDLVYEGGLQLDTSYFLNGRGISYTGNYSFTNIGRTFNKYYLSIYLYDTGFGPKESGQYVKFRVNGAALLDTRESQHELLCAPILDPSMACQWKAWRACTFNQEISSDQLKSVTGGTLLIEAESQGVVSSACPHMDKVVMVKYVLSGGSSQATPSPSMAPTMEPTKASYDVTNGLTLDVNQLDVWQLLQVSIGVGVALAAGAVYLCKLREKGGAQVYQHPMPYAVFSLGFLGMELTSMIFLINNLFRYGYGGSGGALLAFRFAKTCVGGALLAGVFRPPHPMLDFVRFIDQDHFTAESRVYFVVSALCLVDITFISFLPFKNSRFAILSKGMPNLVMFRAVQITVIATAMVSFSIQVSYLASTEFDAERDTFFIMNILLLGVKVFLILAEFFYKSAKLGEAETTPLAVAKEENSGSARERKQRRELEIELGVYGESDVVYGVNPLHERRQEKDTEPLLRQCKELIMTETSKLSDRIAALENVSTTTPSTGATAEDGGAAPL